MSIWPSTSHSRYFQLNLNDKFNLSLGNENLPPSPRLHQITNNSCEPEKTQNPQQISGRAGFVCRLGRACPLGNGQQTSAVPMSHTDWWTSTHQTPNHWTVNSRDQASNRHIRRLRGMVSQGFVTPYLFPLLRRRE